MKSFPQGADSYGVPFVFFIGRNGRNRPNRQTDRQTDRQRDRQTHTHTHTHTSTVTLLHLSLGLIKNTYNTLTEQVCYLLELGAGVGVRRTSNTRSVTAPLNSIFIWFCWADGEQLILTRNLGG